MGVWVFVIHPWPLTENSETVASISELIGGAVQHTEDEGTIKRLVLDSNKRNKHSTAKCQEVNFSPPILTVPSYYRIVVIMSGGVR